MKEGINKFVYGVDHFEIFEVLNGERNGMAMERRDTDVQTGNYHKGSRNGKWFRAQNEELSVAMYANGKMLNKGWEPVDVFNKKNMKK